MKKCQNCCKIPKVSKISDATWEFECCKEETKVFTGFKSKNDAIKNWDYSQTYKCDITLLIRIKNDNSIEVSTNCTTDEHFNDNEFWTSVIKFFVDNPFLDCYHYQQIYDYLSNQKFHNRGNVYVNGVLEIRGPEQPNLSMHKRDPLTLLGQVETWHNRLNRGYYGETCKSSWNTCGIKNFEIKERGAMYEIRELLTSDELYEEGKAMHHCAGSYVHSCANGTNAIFSLAKYSEEETDRMATIQIELATKQIIQAAKKCNARTTSEDWKIIRRWANFNGLTESKWLRY